VHKIRTELETTLQDPAALRQILAALGFRVTFRYEKFRTTLHKPDAPGHVLLDETPIGWFIEIEGPPDWIDSTARDLGFDRAQYVLESYGALYRLHCEKAGVAPSHMVFPE
jgi:adenylate cyclase, class 2